MAGDLKEALVNSLEELRRAEHLFAAIESAAENREFEKPYVLAQIGGHLMSMGFAQAEAALSDDVVVVPLCEGRQRSAAGPAYQRGMRLAIEKLAQWRGLDRTTPKVVADQLRKCNASLALGEIEGFTDVIAVYLSRIMDEDALIDEAVVIQELAGAYGDSHA